MPVRLDSNSPNKLSLGIEEESKFVSLPSPKIKKLSSCAEDVPEVEELSRIDQTIDNYMAEEQKINSQEKCLP